MEMRTAQEEMEECKRTILCVMQPLLELPIKCVCHRNNMCNVSEFLDICIYRKIITKEEV
jgi:hypothetical protein